MLCKDERIEWIVHQADMSEQQLMNSVYEDEKNNMDDRCIVSGYINYNPHLIGSKFGILGMEFPLSFVAACCKCAANAYTLLKSGLVACWTWAFGRG